MNCPSCAETLTDSSKHCSRCGLRITSQSVHIAHLFLDLGWIFRRALGGFTAGCVAALIATGVTRILRFESSGAIPFHAALDLFPGAETAGAVICGAFLGAVSGIIERSSYKTILGSSLGAVGGLVGSLLYPHASEFFSGALYRYSWSMAATWAVVGVFIGVASGILEGKRRKILAGILGGIVGGAVGGGIGSQMYGALLVEIGSPQNLSWAMGRWIEALSGGLLGLFLWLGIGFTEKEFIFRRRILEGTSKICDACQHENNLRAWFCEQCGAALQVAAKGELLRPTPFLGLERLSKAVEFFSGLSYTTGAVIGIAILFLFSADNLFFGLFGALLSAFVFYLLAVVLRSLADTVRLFIALADKKKN